MNRLRELTAELTEPFPQAVCGERVIGSWREYEMDEGTCLAESLLAKDEITVANWFNSKGSIFPSHQHPQFELIWVYRGAMNLFVTEGGVEREIMLVPPAGFYFLDPGTPHRATFPSDCFYIAGTQPASEDWPT